MHTHTHTHTTGRRAPIPGISGASCEKALLKDMPSVALLHFFLGQRPVRLRSPARLVVELVRLGGRW